MGVLLNNQYQYFLNNEKSIIERYEGQFVVIHDEQVVDAFDSEREAYVYSVKHFQMGTFFIQEVKANRTKSKI